MSRDFDIFIQFFAMLFCVFYNFLTLDRVILM